MVAMPTVCPEPGISFSLHSHWRVPQAFFSTGSWAASVTLPAHAAGTELDVPCPFSSAAMLAIQKQKTNAVMAIFVIGLRTEHRAVVRMGNGKANARALRRMCIES